MLKDWLSLIVLLFVLEISKKGRKSSENDQLTGHFQIRPFFLRPQPKSEKKIHIKSTIKKFLALL